MFDDGLGGPDKNVTPSPRVYPPGRDAGPHAPRRGYPRARRRPRRHGFARQLYRLEWDADPRRMLWKESSDVSTAAEHEQRSRDLADATRRYLVGLNTGGAAATLGLAGTLASAGVQPSWAVVPIAVFAAGVLVTGVSLLLAKHKALKRRDAAGAGDPPTRLHVRPLAELHVRGHRPVHLPGRLRRGAVDVSTG